MTAPLIGPEAMVWTGWILTILPSLFLLMDAAMKLAKPRVVVDATVQVGFPESAIVPLGIVLLISVMLYLFPRRLSWARLF